MSLRSQMRYLTPYEIHKAIVNEYVLQRPGDTKYLKRDCSKDKTDLDVIRENHKFLWNNEAPDTWEAQFAKKYYDKLFKEYCIGDLSRYKENKIALRWRMEQEVILGKGQFICGSKICSENDQLRTWEVNFAYQEDGVKKNALVKIRLCPNCSIKLNYRTKKREIKRLSRKHSGEKQKHKRWDKPEISISQNKEASSSNIDSINEKCNEADNSNKSTTVESPWENIKPVETKSREEEMEDYLQDLLL